MVNQLNKKPLFSNKLVLIGLVFIFLNFVIYCTAFHNDSNCSAHLFLTSQSSFVYSLLFFSIILVIFFRRNQNLLPDNISYLSPLIFLWSCKFLFKIYNPILEAFRQGIIHPQIYNFRVVSN